jgi:hypothetical protein
VRARPFYFEIKDMLTQFVAAFDDIVIGRFNKDRVEKDKINVRYVYAPKQRVLYDIINENKTLTLPVVSVNVTNISRDQTRVFNKLDGFYYQGNVGEEKVSRHIKSPVPVNVSLSVSVLTRYQTDMDQILSNFVPFCNPYVIISWKVPEAFNLSVDQEIRSEVLWDGNISMKYPTELNASQKARVTADTTFTIKGWLFKDTDNPSGNIFFIDQNFHTETELEYYDNFESLSGNTYTYPTSTGLDDRIKTFELSGSPFITDIFYNGALLQDDLTISPNTSGNIILNGYGFTHTETVLFSTNNDTVYTNLTSVSGFSRQESVSGQSIPFTVLNDNTIIFNSPPIPSGKLRFIPLNKAGYDFSDLSYMDTLCGRGLSSTFIIVEDLSVTISGDTVDTNTLGTYVVIYSAIDAAGNTGTATRTVVVEDTIAPVVTLNGDNPLNVECGFDYTELNATANDHCDGDLSVTVGGNTVDTNTLGTYTITYSATDSSGNTGTATRTVVVEDTIAPVVTLNGDNPLNVECSTSYTELNATAVDNIDGDLPVTVGGDTVDTSLTGTYVVTYSATDSSGNTGTATRTVVVEDTIAPIVTLNGSSLVDLDTDDTYTELGATANDHCDGDLPVIVGGDTVNTSLTGTYVVTYSATDSSGNTGTATRTVVVSQSAIPCGGAQTSIK